MAETLCILLRCKGKLSVINGIALHVTAQLAIMLLYIHLPNSHKSRLLLYSTSEQLKYHWSLNSSHVLTRTVRLSPPQSHSPSRKMRNMKLCKSVQQSLMSLYKCWKRCNYLALHASTGKEYFLDFSGPSRLRRCQAHYWAWGQLDAGNCCSECQQLYFMGKGSTAKPWLHCEESASVLSRIK